MPDMHTSKYSNADHYLDLETGVLKNRLGISLQEELEKAEADFATARSYELGKTPLKGNFDFDHLLAIHQYLFRDLYEWAGIPRDIDISKGNNFFAHHVHIRAAATTLFDKLAEENHLSGLLREAFSERAAFYLGELNALHPFREGNGRVQREFISQLAQKNGYVIDWSHIDQAAMIEASIESFKGECSKFAVYIFANLKDVSEK